MTGDQRTGPGAGGFAAALKGRGAPSPFWSDVSIAGRPRVLVLDASPDPAGWEAEACARIAASCLRRDIPVAGGAPVHVDGPAAVGAAIDEADASTGDRGPGFNCVFLCARADAGPEPSGLWDALSARLAREPKLFAMCTWDSADPDLAARVLGNADGFARMAVAQQEPMSGRGASLFFMKFFAEVDLHSESTDSITGKMVWFGHSKAREILRRRHYDGRVGLRC